MYRPQGTIGTRQNRLYLVWRNFENDTPEQRRVYRCTERISNKLHANGRPSKVAYDEKERKQIRGLGERDGQRERTLLLHRVSGDVCMHTKSSSTRYDAIEGATRLRSLPEHPGRVAWPGPGRETRNVLFPLHSFPHLPCPPPSSSYSSSSRIQRQKVSGGRPTASSWSPAAGTCATSSKRPVLFFHFDSLPCR